MNPEVPPAAIEESPAPPGPPETPGPRPLRRIDVAVLVAILIVTGAVRFARLGSPGDVLPRTDDACKLIPTGETCYATIPLDETHYVPDARDVLEFGTESDERVSERDARLDADDGAFVVHPPVGKWLIAAGIWLFGDRPFGWRFFGALFGSIAVLIVYLLGRRLWASPWAAAAAAFLLGIEGLWFVQSRVAMLDVYAATFVLLGVWLLVEDDARAPLRGLRWWRIGAGAAFGLAVATKWSVAPFLAVGGLFAFAWDVRRSLADGGAGRLLGRAAGLVGALLVLPAALYVATYTPWFVDSHRYSPCREDAGVFTQWWCYQDQILDFHRNLDKFEAKGDDESPSEDPTPSGTGSPTATASGSLEPGHPYFGEAWTWPWIGRPVVHDNDITCTGARAGDRRCDTRFEAFAEVVGIPNPAIWWPGFFVAFPLLAWWSIRRDRTALILFALFAAGYLPYLAADAVSRPVFFFYATPLVPFLAMGVVHVGVRAVRRWPWLAWIAVLYVAGAALSFAYFYPVLAAYPIPRQGAFGWVGHMWLRIDCLEQDVVKKACWI